MDGVNTKIPPELLDAITSGECVAFVGAGFSAAAGLPSWGVLLTRIVEATKARLGSDLVDQLMETISAATLNGNSDLFERVAQMLEDRLGPEEVVLHMQELLRREEIPDIMAKRLKLLDSIPFRAIVTTNFDLFMVGEVPSKGHPPYHEVLRPTRLGDRYVGRYSEDLFVSHILETADTTEKKAARDARIASGEQEPVPTIGSEVHAKASAKTLADCQLISRAGRPIIKVHGCVGDSEPLVWAKSGYRKLLHFTPGYASFIRTLLATSTVLYLGFSFSDAYLNELRSEVLAMLNGPPPAMQHTNRKSSATDQPDAAGELATQGPAQPPLPRPIGYAVVPDMSPHDCRFFLRHEGVEIIPYSTKDAAGIPNKVFTGFDTYLSAISWQSSYSHFLGKALSDKRVMIVDMGEDVAKSGWTTFQPLAKILEHAVDVHKGEGDAVVAKLDKWTAVNPDETRGITRKGPCVAYVVGIEKAIAELAKACPYMHPSTAGDHEPYDLLLLPFGEDKDATKDFGAANANHTWVQLLRGMRSLSLRAQSPFIVYSSDHNLVERHKFVVRNGGFGVAVSPQEFMTLVLRLFDDRPVPPHESPAARAAAAPASQTTDSAAISPAAGNGTGSADAGAGSQNARDPGAGPGIICSGTPRSKTRVPPKSYRYQ